MAASVAKMFRCRCLFPRITKTFQGCRQKRLKSSESADNPSMDRPVEYSKSKAHDWQAQDTFAMKTRSAPWYEAPIITVSSAIFLIYFCMLREENDVDKELGKTIFERIPGLEEQTVQGHKNYLHQMEDRYERQGKST